MDLRSWTLLLVLAAIWGASYLFIELGLEDLTPAQIVFGRTALAAVALLPLAWRRGALRGWGPYALPLVLLAAVQVAGPFLLISFGQEEVTSSLAGILVASTPIFTALLAPWIDREERSSGTRLLGVAVGIVGVALLLGVDVGGDAGALVGALMIVLATVGYALGAFYVKRRFTDTEPLGLVTLTMVASAALSAPLAATGLGDATLHLKSAAAMAVLGIVGTGIAFIIFYSLIADVGPSRAALVTYIAPIFAVFYGVTLLDEPFTIATFAGLVLVVAGSFAAAGGAAGPAEEPVRELAG